MKKIDENQYVLTAIELAALCDASIERATQLWNKPGWAPQDEALPHIVSKAHELLYGIALYKKEE